MKRVMFARFLPVDYEQTLYSLYQNCRQYSRTISEYAKEFMRLALRNQLSESDAQQVARFNNGLRYDIQAIVSLQTTWTMASLCFKCQKVGHTSNQYRATKRVNLAEGDKAHSESEEEGLIISPNAVFEDDDDHNEVFLGIVRRLVLTSTKKIEDSQRHNIFLTRCKINQDVFNVIVDEGSSENIISRDIVTRLKLTPKKHPKPYKWIGWIKVVGGKSNRAMRGLFAMGKYKNTERRIPTFSKGGRKFTLCPYSDEVQATTTKEKKNPIMLCSTRNKDKNICVTTISPDKVLNPIRNSWLSSFQEWENDGDQNLDKRKKDDSRRNNFENKKNSSKSRKKSK
nr:hypothetical protein CTI12_AA288430 [Tanacetum cinerariifolium]